MVVASPFQLRGFCRSPVVNLGFSGCKEQRPTKILWGQHARMVRKYRTSLVS